ncbi:NAD(P)-dependent dehydrogenase, short-chain alcohol dehydrogenase family [Nakamurella panacisegetis]|uniref:NAD(P)-dependent dehydrogenase, short-chain alcohol dehydrogenase family n=1 Tax=Nakamurella panacisegetis TaxID=1090615 RepID=A0A1H0HL53_9ACTN|nr:SDR family oxidoreductase [Nakamurella panacisegetis]SDO19774.1 NAD(P)-dependent dehydrogenase, short-chain alcohol dehydrogenase family [Nakamurella panacisegetis]
MAGRVSVITGAGSGIGAVIAARAAAAGDLVVVADIDGDAAARVSATIAGSRPVTVDVTVREQVSAMIEQVERAAGPVGLLVNNAAVASDVPFDSLSEQIWRRDIAVSLDGAFHTISAVLPGMIAAGGGAIVNIASVNGLTYVGNEAYSAAKAGLISLTRSIAVRYGRHGIRCNAVAPGTVATPIWEERMAVDPDVITRAAKWYPLGRIGRPEDVAAAVLFLAGDDASWISGVTLPVDGGLLAGRLQMADEIAIAGTPVVPDGDT